MPKKATILIVDKEKILVDLLIRTLSSAELSVVGATSAEEGARLIDSHAPDLIVIDPSLHAAEEIRTRAKAIGAQTIDRNAGFDELVAAIRRQLPSDLKVLGNEIRISVLVCDDEQELRNLLSEFLKTKGYAVGEAGNGREAVEYIRNHPETKIALLDVSMPVMGGMEALGQIMQYDPHPHVLMMTAVADREVARQAMKTGAFDYILKPFDFGAIESSITACLSHFEYQKQPWWKKFTRG